MQNFLNPPWEPMILSLQTGPRLRATNPGSQTPASTATRPTAALDQWLTPASFPAFPLTAGMWRQICPPGNHVGHPSFCQPASSSSSQLQSWKACLFFHQKSCPLPHEPGVSASGEWRLTPLLCRRVLDKLACSHLETLEVASVVKNSPVNVDVSSIPGLGRVPGEENGNWTWDPCLENSVNRGAWRFTVHRSQSLTWLSARTHSPLRRRSLLMSTEMISMRTKFRMSHFHVLKSCMLIFKVKYTSWNPPFQETTVQWFSSYRNLLNCHHRDFRTLRYLRKKSKTH